MGPEGLRRTAGAPGDVDRELVEERADGLASALCAACRAIDGYQQGYTQTTQSTQSTAGTMTCGTRQPRGIPGDSAALSNLSGSGLSGTG